MENIKHKINFDVPSSDFTEAVKKELLVTQSREGNDMVFSVNVPKIIYDTLVDTEKKYRSYSTMQKEKKERKRHGIIDYNLDKPDEYLKSTITHTLLSTLLVEISDLTSIIIINKNRGKLHKKKKIFVKFRHSKLKDKCDWTYGYKGTKLSAEFQFFVGYEIDEPLDMFSNKTIPRYYTYKKYSQGNIIISNELEPLHFREGTRQFENTYDIIDYSEEAEDFLSMIQNRFDELNNKLHDFLGNITNEKMSKLLSDRPPLFLE